MTEVYIKTKKVLPLILLLFVAIMLFSVGMIAKEYRERQQDIKGFEKLEDIITEVNSEIKRLCDWIDSHDTSFTEYDDMVIRRVWNV